MTSDINICNMALGNIGAEPIVSFEDATQAARICNSYYSHVLDELLASHAWDFNRRQLKLVLTSETMQGWKHVYAYPPTALYIDGLFTADDEGAVVDEHVDYDVLLGDKRRIATDAEGNVYALCRVSVPDVSMWPPFFCEVMIWALSTRIALAITKSAEIASTCNSMYAQALGRALAASANEPHKPVKSGSSWLEARD